MWNPKRCTKIGKGMAHTMRLSPSLIHIPCKVYLWVHLAL